MLASPSAVSAARLLALDEDGASRPLSRPGGVLADDLCHVSIHPVAPSDADVDLLDPDERERMERIVRPTARRRFAFAHATLRRVLSAYADADPASLRFTRRPCLECGAPDVKPGLADGALEFNLSHSERAVAIAVADGRPVGVDVEDARRADRAGRGPGRLLPGEREWLASLPPGDRGRAFLELWTRKEARGKATGHGIWHALAEWDAREPDPADGFLVRSLAAGPAVVAAVAVRAG